jgi:eukaryotic translation initiation factor 2C
VETGQRSRSVLVPVNRPDGGGKKAIGPIRLYANHFRVNFNPALKIFHYDFDIQRVSDGSGKREKEKKGPGKTEKEVKVGRVSKEDTMEIKNKLLQENRAAFGNARIVFDGKKNIYSTTSLPEGKYTVKLVKDEEGPAKEFSVALKYTGHELNGGSLAQFLNINDKRHVELNADLLQCLDLVMREHPNENRILVGRSLYPKQFERDGEIGGVAMASRGFYQSLRPTAQGLVLNVDLSAIVFHKSIPVLNYLWESCRVDCRENQVLSERDLKEAKKALKGLKVKVTHRRCSQKFTIIGLTKQITREIKFPMSEDNGPPRMVNMLDFFRSKHKANIAFKMLPCLDISKSKEKPNYIPMEFCVVCEGQRFPRDNLNGSQSKNFHRIACPSADERQRRINQIMLSQDGPKNGPFLPHFGMAVVGDMTKLMGRVLEAPTIKLGEGGRNKQVTPAQDNRQWNLMSSHVFDGKRIDKWGLINFSWDQPSPQLSNMLQMFTTSLVRRCGEVGVTMNRAPLVSECHPMRLFDDMKGLQQTLLDVHRKAKGQLQILICVMEEKHHGYTTLKLIAETDIGLVTQCCLFEHVRKCSDQRSQSQASQYLANLALKMNAKVGGSNAALLHGLSRQLPRFGNDHVMYIGADVNHPGSGDSTSPSIASVVGSINWPWCNRYNARVSYQTHRVEHIQQLEEMSKELLDDYLKANKRLPDRILFFRDGVSESQFDMVLNMELVALREAVAHFKDYNPPVSFIVAQKRHHTRLFLGDGEQKTRSGNVPPGTVVDTVIVHPRQFDFYLCSHNGLLGTSKPTHYHVLWDDNRFSSDELETLINNLCYTFARCTKPVSLAPPVYYADLAAYRGRLYLQGLAFTSSETASTSSSSSSSSQLNFPKLHDGVKNAMFFC